MGEAIWKVVSSKAADATPSQWTICAIILAGLAFVAFELFLTYGPPESWLRMGFKANPKLRVDQIDECIRQAKSRLVGSLHLIIQIPLALWVMWNRQSRRRTGFWDVRSKFGPIPLALWVMWTPELAGNRLAGKTASSRLMLTISAGYFLYDAAVSILRYEGVAYMLHGVVSCCLYTYGALTGWLGYYGAAFLLWECSTPFVYARWFLFTLGKSESKAYIVNGLCMLATFFIFRNVIGVATSIDFWRVSGRELAQPRHLELLPAILWFYRLSCVSLNCLNAMWFYKMAKGAAKILGGKKSPKDVAGDTHVELQREPATSQPAAKKVS